MTKSFPLSHVPSQSNQSRRVRFRTPSSGARLSGAPLCGAVAAAVFTLGALSACGGDAEAPDRGAPLGGPPAPGAAPPDDGMPPGPAEAPSPPPSDAPPSDAEPAETDEGVGEVPLDPSVDDEAGGGEAPAEEPVEPAPEEPAPPLEPLDAVPVECAALPNAGNRNDGDINVVLDTEFQVIRGFGGIAQPRWIDDLTPEQADTAFGNQPGQLDLSILRLGISYDPADFPIELPTAQRAVSLGARIFATPWTPPPELKSNQDIVSGELLEENYGAYADHLLSFRDFMADNGITVEAISIQNEPDIAVTYESCDWTPAQMASFLTSQGPRFGDTKIIAAESFNFNRQATDPLLNDPAVAEQLDIVGGHIYGNGLADYPLARQRGKEVWMTEHYTDSGNEPDRANFWPLALDVGRELHDSMVANFNAYVWWYIRRGYGLITDDGVVSKRGYFMSQYSRYVRPGFVRVAASTPNVGGVGVTAYKNGAGSVVVVALNESQTPQNVNLDIFGSCVTGFDRFTTSETKNAQQDPPVALTSGRAAVTLDPQSVTTFVSQPIGGL